MSEAGERLLEHLTSLGRKRSTLGDYESYLRIHLVPFFGERALERIEPAEVEAFIAAKRREGRRRRASSTTSDFSTRSSPTGSGAAWCAGTR